MIGCDLSAKNMSIVSDGDVLQDVVAPDLKVIREKVDNLEKRLDPLQIRLESGFQQVDAKVQQLEERTLRAFEQADAKVHQLEERMLRAFEQADAKATERHLALMNSFDLQSRVQRMEADLRRLEQERKNEPARQH